MAFNLSCINQIMVSLLVSYSEIETRGMSSGCILQDDAAAIQACKSRTK
jgi:hypothetical protein